MITDSAPQTKKPVYLFVSVTQCSHFNTLLTLCEVQPHGQKLDILRRQCGRVDKEQSQLAQATEGTNIHWPVSLAKGLVAGGGGVYLTLQYLCHQIQHSEGFIGGIFPLMSPLSGSIWNLKMLPSAKGKHFIKNLLCSKHLKGFL